MKDFELHLRKAGLAENTIRSYLYGVRFFLEHYELKIEDLFEYKGYLLDNFKPKTVNLRLQGLNKYLVFIGHDDLKLKFVKIQQKPFLEDVISHADYLFLKRSLKKDDNLKWHFVVWFLGATGARVSELIKLKVEHVEVGYFDIYSKGVKCDDSTSLKNYVTVVRNGLILKIAKAGTFSLINLVSRLQLEGSPNN